MSQFRMSDNPSPSMTYCVILDADEANEQRDFIERIQSKRHRGATVLRQLSKTMGRTRQAAASLLPAEQGIN
jgi:hypothetical protein